MDPLADLKLEPADYEEYDTSQSVFVQRGFTALWSPLICKINLDKKLPSLALYDLSVEVSEACGSLGEAKLGCSGE